MNLFPTTYSSLSTAALLDLVVSNYNVDNTATIIFLKRGFNDTYLIGSNDKKYILRVYKHNWRSLKSIKGEIELLHLLKENNIQVSYPIKDKQDNYIQHVQAAEGTRYATLFSYAEGKQIRKLNEEQAYLLGQETASIHLLTQNRSFSDTAQNYDFEHQFDITLTTLKSILKDHPEEYTYLEDLRNKFINTLNSVDKNQLSIGICHGDLQAENFHITENNEFTFFDFDFFGTGYLIYDIGVFIWYDHKNKPAPIINSFIKGYTSKRELTETELQLLPYVSTLRALFQMTLYCRINDGKQLPLWPASEIASFITKIKKWFKHFYD
jgi:Ser/Thr protein kinase RdoA (MazF antagonist)